LEAVNNELDAKNKEFEVQMQKFKEKTAQNIQEIKITAIIDKY
jgi:hypothetical protein